MSEIKSYKTYIPQKNTGIEIVDSIVHVGRLAVEVGIFSFNSSLDLIMTGYLAESSGTGSDGSGVMDIFGVRTVGWEKGNISVGATNADHIILRSSPDNNANWMPVINTNPITYGTYKLHLAGNNGKVTSAQLYLNDTLLQSKAPQYTNITGNAVYFCSGLRVSKSRIDSAKVYVDGELVRDLAPAYNHATSKYGLVDTLTDTFYSQATYGVVSDNVTPTPALNYIISIPNYKTNVSTGGGVLLAGGNTYTKLKYIEATQQQIANGYAQWIETGLYCETSDIIEIKGRFTDISTSRVLFGCHRTSWYRRFGVLRSGNTSYWAGSACSQGGQAWAAINGLGEADTNTHIFIFNHAENSMKIDDKKAAFAGGYNTGGREAPSQGTSGDNNVHNTMALLACKHDADVGGYSVGGGTGATWAARFQLEYCKIYRTNGTMRANYIPVLNSDGIPGVYDYVSNTFKSNMNTDNGKFSYLEPYIRTFNTIIKDN